MTPVSAASPLVRPLLEDRFAGAGQVAVAMDRTRITYGELRRNVLAAAESLRRIGIGEGDRVAFALPKSVRTVEFLLALLVVGAAYVPLNRKLPPPALSRVLRDLEPRLFVAGPDVAKALLGASDLPAGLCLAESDGSSPEVKLLGPIPRTPARASECQGLATILYTSGSTGEPKGIMLSHDNVASFVEWAVKAFEISHNDRLANHAPLHFDLSILDIFCALSRHASVHLIGETAAQFPGAVRSLVAAEKISVWYSVPTALTRLQERRALSGLGSLRWILFAGEVFPLPALKRLMTDVPGAQYANLYGPAETNVCTYYRVPEPPVSVTDPLPIGKACEHLEVTIRDSQGATLKQGEEGEICVSGPAVMKGYWRRPDLTRAARPSGRDGSYRTGDYGYVRPDGNFMLTGRRDQQVKIRGHRIELLALETVLNAHPSVSEAVCAGIADERSGGELVVFAVPDGEPAALAEIRDFASARLSPAYRPDRIVWLSGLPRTATGKCDRALLRARAQIPESK